VYLPELRRHGDGLLAMSEAIGPGLRHSFVPRQHATSQSATTAAYLGQYSRHPTTLELLIYCGGSLHALSGIFTRRIRISLILDARLSAMAALWQLVHEYGSLFLSEPMKTLQTDPSRILTLQRLTSEMLQVVDKRSQSSRPRPFTNLRVRTI
jgi:hypothetical protein